MEEKEIIFSKQLIVIGGSSGALDALLTILSLLNKDFNIPVIIVFHRSQGSDNGLIDVLSSRSALQIKEADEKDELLPGYMYVAPADYHLLIENNGSLSLDVSEKVYYSRPSIEVSFLSAASAYKENLVAVLLSGANADGAYAMTKVKALGGKNIVQDPAEAAVPYMPEQAIALSPIDNILPAHGIAALLNQLSEDLKRKLIN
ncbi:MAG: chemotaxis protein CheB [Agriterribacter sp.]